MNEFPSVPTATSEAAADAVNPVSAKVLREKVFQAIKDAPDGLTDEEIQLLLDLSGNTQRPRRWELSHKQGRIRTSGTRETQAGRQANVWVANDFPVPLAANGSAIEPATRRVSVQQFSADGQLLQSVLADRKIRVDGIITLTNFTATLIVRSGNTIEIEGCDD